MLDLIVEALQGHMEKKSCRGKEQWAKGIHCTYRYL